MLLKCFDKNSFFKRKNRFLIGLAKWIVIGFDLNDDEFGEGVTAIPLKHP